MKLKDIIVISGQSGAGKGTLITKLRAQNPDKFYYVRSTTSRAPRTTGETAAIDLDKQNYIFVSAPEFERKITAGEMLEWAQVHGHYYGKSKAEFAEAARRKKMALVEIDVQGMRAVKKAYGDRVKTIFIVVPSLEELARRLRHRGTETEAQIATRLETARREADYISEYDYQIVNDKLNTALAELEEIIMKK